MQYGNTLTQRIENVRIPSVRRHTLVGVVMASLCLPGFLAACDAMCGSLVFGFIPHGPQLPESISTPGMLQQHRSCSSCYNTAVAGMHSQDGWLLGHALAVVHRRLVWLSTLLRAYGTTAAFNAITARITFLVLSFEGL